MKRSKFGCKRHLRSFGKQVRWLTLLDKGFSYAEAKELRDFYRKQREMALEVRRHNAALSLASKKCV